MRMHKKGVDFGGLTVKMTKGKGGREEKSRSGVKLWNLPISPPFQQGRV